MKFDTFEYRIGTHFLPSLINGDSSGMEEAEERQLDQWLASLPCAGRLGHWSYDTETTEEFSRCEVTDMMGETVTATFNAQVQS